MQLTRMYIVTKFKINFVTTNYTVYTRNNPRLRGNSWFFLQLEKHETSAAQDTNIILLPLLPHELDL